MWTWGEGGGGGNSSCALHTLLCSGSELCRQYQTYKLLTTDYCYCYCASWMVDGGAQASARPFIYYRKKIGLKVLCVPKY